MATDTKHTREEWGRNFEALNGRRPSTEEYLEAEQRGDFKELEVKKSVSESKYRRASPSREKKQSLLSELLELILEVIFYAATASGAILPFWLTSSHTNLEFLNVFGSIKLDLRARYSHSHFYVEVSYWPLFFLGLFVYLILALLSEKFRSSERPVACLVNYLVILIFILISWMIIPFLVNVVVDFVFRHLIPGY